MTVKEAQANTGWLETLGRGITGDGIRGEKIKSLNWCILTWIGYGALIREYVYFLQAKLAFHRHHPEFNG